MRMRHIGVQHIEVVSPTIRSQRNRARDALADIWQRDIFPTGIRKESEGHYTGLEDDSMSCHQKKPFGEIGCRCVCRRYVSSF